MKSKSTISIYGRVRPLKKNSKFKADAGRYWIESNNEKSNIGFHIPKDQLQGSINHQKENFEFEFDKVFDVDTTQEEIFDVVAKPVVESSLTGYNGTIFAYGQTGSGKTFTITGGAESYADRGLIPRTIQYIFKSIETDSQTSYQIHISYLEIYNECGYDLLDGSRDAKKLEDLPKVTLKVDEDELIHVRNLSTIPVNSEEDALNLLFLGDTNKTIAETPSNPSSSRSHCIFIISITSRRKGQDVIRRSKLHLVDLAGSERVAKTGIDGTLLKEARHINLSLHFLEQVIIALHEASKGKRPHIPYRNSMMTSLLRDSLGGNCKTTMIATIAVEQLLIDESISTCRFAQRVALISNNATLNEELDPALLIERLKQEISRLKAELAIARGDEKNEYPDGLPDYEKERIKDAVNNYLQDSSPDADLVFSDFKKIQYAFEVLKGIINSGDARLRSNNRSIGGRSSEMMVNQDGLSSEQVQQIENLKKLAEHRDNEINILVGMISQLKEKLNKSPNSTSGHLPSLSTSQQIILPDRSAIVSDSPIRKSDEKPGNRTVIPQFSTEKAEAFEQFKKLYPSTSWIDSQKLNLKQKYATARAQGAHANNLRQQMTKIKEQLSNPDLSNHDQLRETLTELITNYKSAYQTLKTLKSEIEHMEHLLEQGRIRMTRDFETWFLNIHTQSNSIPVPSFESIPSAVQNDAISSTEKQEQTSRVAVGAFRKQSPPTIRELLSTTEIRHRSNSKPAWPPSGMENDIYPRPKSVSSFSKPNLNPLIHIHPKTDSSITLANEEVIHINPQQKQSSRTRSRVIDDNVYKRPSSALSQSSTRSDNSSVREDIQAFYKARQELLARQGYPRE